MNRKLGKCPTCGRVLDGDTRAAMGLRNGEKLNELCPGRNGPSDIDHVIHNMHARPFERAMFLEYKNEGMVLTQGQQYLHKAVTGDWKELTSGRLISIRVVTLWPSQEWMLPSIVDWVWPGDALCPGSGSMTSTPSTAR